MNIKNFNIKDYFKIDDDHSKIRGFMVLEDTEGNIIRAKENMIVKNGRRLILKKLLSTDANTTTFKKISFGNGTSITESINNDLTGSKLSDSSTSNHIIDINFNSTRTTFVYSKNYSTDSNKNFSPVLADGDYNYYDGTTTNLASKITISNNTSSDKIEASSNYFINNNNIYKVHNLPTFNDAIFVEDDNNLLIHLNIFISKSSNINSNISELGIFLSDNDNTMFSRVVFEPVPFNNSTDYILNYYIYF